MEVLDTTIPFTLKKMEILDTTTPFTLKKIKLIWCYIVVLIQHNSLIQASGFNLLIIIMLNDKTYKIYKQKL